MTTLVDRQHIQHFISPAISPWVAALIVTAVFSFGLGASIELPQSNSADIVLDGDIPDWHGNVKRSHGG
ncbi:MAG: hypothetical protein JXQ85_07075 [Cognatishimia sp.]|uniref:hypothetical protein n=1 Tax=Cognatishimia sp. TaxID=2211648 RepID=UPI003B8C3EDA